MKASIIIGIFLFIHSLAPQLGFAAEVPPIVEQGLEQLVANGPAKAVEIWLKGSALDADITAKTRAAGALASASEFMGKARQFEKIDVVSITPSCLRVYGAIVYEKGVLFGWWDCFLAPGDKYLIHEFQFQTAAEKVLPPAYLTGRK